MGFWDRLVNGLAVVSAAFFVYIGIAFLIMPLAGTGKAIEGGASPDKAFVGIAFLLAAAPLLYYVFAPSARGLPPPERKAPPPKAPEPPAN